MIIDLSNTITEMFSAIKCISSQRLSSTFAHQINIPRLKIPTLVDTTTRYIESLKPLLSETSIQSTQNQIDTFIAPHSIGSILQTRLNELNDREPVIYFFMKDILLIDISTLGWKTFG